VSSLHLKYPSGHTLAECRDIQLAGLPGVGGYTLSLALKFSVNHSEAETFLTHVNLRLEWGDNAQRLIGVALPEGQQPLTVPKYNSMTIYFRLLLSPAQIEGIETLRTGGDFSVNVWLNGEVSSQNSVRGFSERGTFPVKQSDWVNVLQNMGYTQTVLYEFPISRALEQGPAKSHIENARKYLHQGEYDLCVGECRKIFELFPLSNDSQNVIGEVRKKYPNRNDRESLSVHERWLLLRDVLMSLTHPPHHSEQTSSYSRDQAKMILASTMAYCSA
jgi:hypothetical protein